jgi:hypothetical protein
MLIGPVGMAPTLILLGLLAGGILLVISWMLSAGGGDARDSIDEVSAPCPRCHHVNPTHARYCARCGRSLQ